MNGTGSCLQEGTVKIRLIDDAGTQHIFILDNCLYHPESPVNVLSMRRLAEKFLDADGGLHYKMNHIPLPVMITLAEKREAQQKVC